MPAFRSIARPSLLTCVAVTLLVSSGCGGDDEAPSSQQDSTVTAKSVASLAPGDLEQNAEFWKTQSPEGKLVLTRMCKAQVARAAEAQAASSSDDALDSVSAGNDAKHAIDDISADDLVPGIDRSIAAAPGTTIGEACENVLSGAIESTQIQVRGANREPALGNNAYSGQATDVLQVTVVLTPAGEDAQFDLERRIDDDWEYIDTYRGEASGEFPLKLKAYRRNSNLYRVRATGSGNAEPATAEIYFDGAGVGG